MTFKAFQEIEMKPFYAKLTNMGKKKFKVQAKIDFFQTLT